MSVHLSHRTYILKLITLFLREADIIDAAILLSVNEQGDDVSAKKKTAEQF